MSDGPLSGEFAVPDDGDRSRTLTRRWEHNWPGSEPLGHRLRVNYPDRWVRFHNLPGSKRLAGSTDEYAEIVRRQRTVLAELGAGLAVEDLVVIVEEWDSRDAASGSSVRHVPDAWPWRTAAGDDPELGSYYFWATGGLTEERLDALLRAAADDEAHVVLANPDLDWLFCPYDGGVDVIAADAGDRDALRAVHSEWLSPHPDGL